MPECAQRLSQRCLTLLWMPNKSCSKVTSRSCYTPLERPQRREQASSNSDCLSRRIGFNSNLPPLRVSLIVAQERDPNGYVRSLPGFPRLPRPFSHSQYPHDPPGSRLPLTLVPGPTLPKEATGTWRTGLEPDVHLCRQQALPSCSLVMPASALLTAYVENSAEGRAPQCAWVDLCCMSAVSAGLRCKVSYQRKLLRRIKPPRILEISAQICIIARTEMRAARSFLTGIGFDTIGIYSGDRTAVHVTITGGSKLSSPTSGQAEQRQTVLNPKPSNRSLEWPLPAPPCPSGV